MESVKRPLSPHLQIYKPQLTSILSITHRGTGVFLSLGALLLTCWLVGLNAGEEVFNSLQLHTSTWYGKISLSAFVFSFYFHFTNGVRHLFWDAGKGLEIKTVYVTGYTCIAMSIVLSVITLYFGGAI